MNVPLIVFLFRYCWPTRILLLGHSSPVLKSGEMPGGSAEQYCCFWWSGSGGFYLGFGSSHGASCKSSQWSQWRGRLWRRLLIRWAFLLFLMRLSLFLFSCFSTLFLVDCNRILLVQQDCETILFQLIYVTHKTKIIHVQVTVQSLQTTLLQLLLHRVYLKVMPL